MKKKYDVDTVEGLVDYIAALEYTLKEVRKKLAVLDMKRAKERQEQEYYEEDS